MKKLLILLAGLAIIAMVAVPTIIMQPEDRINPTTQSVNVVDAVNATTVLPQATVAPTQTPAETVQGVTYELEVDTAKITLTLPSEYEMLPLEWYDFVPHPERYEFLNAETGCTFEIFAYSSGKKDTELYLRKMMDPANKLVYEDVNCNAYQVWAHTRLDNNSDHGFLVIADNGYSYSLSMRLPDGQGQNSPPEEALKILETLQITGK